MTITTSTTKVNVIREKMEKYGTQISGYQKVILDYLGKLKLSQ